MNALSFDLDRHASTKFQTVISAHESNTDLTFVIVDYKPDSPAEIHPVTLYVTFQGEEHGTVILDHGNFSSRADAEVTANLLSEAHQSTKLAVEQLGQAIGFIAQNGPQLQERPTQDFPHGVGFGARVGDGADHHHKASQFGFTA